ncbi:Kelch repeat type 1 [Arabidopsis thaliana x Arabidopsis arenosa]|uniref:Kelch repeat type 1 n=1 Tax=Arabidopsis thaliana x Arabidopsis arenosa TaxID=1240361 RepID=A0A8T2A754_9BRAS|nr:Kelch repeat type 1 [Arabidopsis thaliana x Arabidopsis arenosa]
MVFISETSDDGSNGGDPTKNLQQEQEDNQNENPQQVEENPQEVEENLPPIPQEVPEELIESTVALVRSCHYPSLSLLSKAFRRVISSPGLYHSRLLLGLTDPVLYALIGFSPYNTTRLYILNRNIPRNISLRLSLIGSLPPLNHGSAVVTIGYDMYVIGGHNHQHQPTSDVFIIDLRFHTCLSLPRMKRRRVNAAAEVIDGRIYVIGGCAKLNDHWIEVFDIENRTWSTVPDPDHNNSSLRGGGFLTCVVMQEMICILDTLFGFSYEPRQGLWQSIGLETQLNLHWKVSCVIEDLLYCIDPRLGHRIVVYDLNELVWRPVMGAYVLPDFCYNQCKMANFGGKLVILGSVKSSLHGLEDVWYLEIALEKRQGGEIWGKVDSLEIVLRSVNSPSIDLLRSVTF